MAGTHYEVAYVARSPASMQQDEFAAMQEVTKAAREWDTFSIEENIGPALRALDALKGKE